MALASTCHARKVPWGRGRRCFEFISCFIFHLVCGVYCTTFYTWYIIHKCTHARAVHLKKSNIAWTLHAICQMYGGNYGMLAALLCVIVPINDTGWIVGFQFDLYLNNFEPTNRTINFIFVNFRFSFISNPETRNWCLSLLWVLTSWFKANNCVYKKNKRKKGFGSVAENLPNRMGNYTY